MQELKANLPIMVKPDAQESAKEAPTASQLQTVRDFVEAKRNLATTACRGDTFSKPAAPVKVHAINNDAPHIPSHYLLLQLSIDGSAGEDFEAEIPKHISE